MHAPDFAPAAFCAYVAKSEHGQYEDAPAGALARLRAEGLRVVPQSECQFPEYRLKTDRTEAALIGVSSIEWKGDDFVRLQAGRMIGPLAGRGYEYTLSRTAHGWLVDAVRETWIS